MMQNKTIVIGLTGAAGTGKSTVLGYMEGFYGASVLECDAIGASLQKPGGTCYDGMKALFGEEDLLPSGEFDRSKIADKVFADPDLLKKLNELIHPAVKRELEKQIRKEREEAGDQRKIIVIESAILVEAGLKELCDRIWVVRADEKVRRERLKRDRGYSEKRIDDMMARQQDEAFFLINADLVIDNSSDDLFKTFGQVDRGIEDIWNSVR